MTQSRITALIPAYNESKHITGVISGVLEHLPVIVVDDGSTDDTAPASLLAGAQVIRQPKNQGKGAALVTGIQRALEDGCRVVVTLDADGQHDPAEIPKFLNAYHSDHPDLIVGKRDFRLMPPIRRMANTLGALSFSWALRQEIPDNQSGYRLVGSRLMTAMLESDERGFEFEVEMIRICAHRGYSMAWVPIRTIYTGSGSHIQPVRHLKEFLRVVWQTRRAS
jgi:glycosyltransferase involved in cell wall biosynthesis